MSVDPIPRPEWLSFLQAFTGSHRGWLMTVDCTRAGAEPIRVMHDVPLVGVFAEPERLVIDGGAADDRVCRVIDRPAALWRSLAAAGIEDGLDVETDAGERVHLRFRSAIRPELVDGL